MSRLMTIGLDLRDDDLARYRAIHAARVRLDRALSCDELDALGVPAVPCARERARHRPGGRHHGPYRRRRCVP